MFQSCRHPEIEFYFVPIFWYGGLILRTLCRSDKPYFFGASHICVLSCKFQFRFPITLVTETNSVISEVKLQATRFPACVSIFSQEHMKVQPQEFKQRSAGIAATTGSTVVQLFYLQLKSINSLIRISYGSTMLVSGKRLSVQCKLVACACSLRA
jgi:hypothetical protein